MCDVKKYSDIYKEIAKLNPKDTLQLVLESETEEQISEDSVHCTESFFAC